MNAFKVKPQDNAKTLPTKEMKEVSGGYMAVDRDEAIRRNLETIKRLHKQFSDIQKDKNSSSTEE